PLSFVRDHVDPLIPVVADVHDVARFRVAQAKAEVGSAGCVDTGQGDLYDALGADIGRRDQLGNTIVLQTQHAGTVKVECRCVRLGQYRTERQVEFDFVKVVVTSSCSGTHAHNQHQFR